MDNFKVIYRLLKILERAMDLSEFDVSGISAEVLHISEERWCFIIEMLVKEGYIEGISIKYSLDGQVVISSSRPKITLKGLEYMNENTMMKKAAGLMKGIKDVIPGL